jgi:hypothetical protein
MAFNRLIYDECTVEVEMKQNTSFFDAHMDPSRFVHTEPCRHALGIVGSSSGVSSVFPAQTPLNNIDKIRGDMVALENDLRGQTRPATRCPKYDYVPKKGVITSEELWKPVKHPVINTDRVVHPQTCQMISYPEFKP